jgi:putative transposase
LAELKSKRDHCKKGSHRWHQYNTKYLKSKRKCANQMRDFQHKISKQIVNNTKANTIIIGDLNVKEMAKKKKGTGNAKRTKINKTLNHSVHNTGSLGRFAQFLTYKAELVGKRVIRIDESYTTQDSCICGNRVKRKISQRTIICDWGNPMKRDQNSSVNIMERFLKNKTDFDFLSH